MVKGLLGRVPLVYFLFDHALQELLRLWGVSSERFVVEMEGALDHIADDFELGIAREGHFSGQHNVEDHTKGPNVNL